MIGTIYTVLFTLDGKDPSKNKYVDMFFIWFLFLKKFGDVSNTNICLYIDTTTMEYLKTIDRFNNILSNCQVFPFPSPSSLMEGMKRRYIVAQNFQNTNPGQLYMYMDLDVLVYKPLSILLNTSNTDKLFYIHTEENLFGLAGNILSDNYVGTRISFTDKEKESFQHMGGISSGLFAWHHMNSEFSEFFKNILDTIQNDYQKYYTVDQPYFNEAVLRYIPNELVCVMDSHLIGFNQIYKDIETIPYVLINYAGEPGDDSLHFSKLLEAYSLVFQD